MSRRPQRLRPANGAARDVRPFASGLAACGAWVLGTDRLQWRRLQLILVAAGVYGLSVLAQWNAVASGMADRELATWLAAFIIVTDTGVGIEAAGLAHIFEPFRQADEGADRRYGGSGMGLAIVRQLVVAMGGHIGVTSRLGEGSQLEIELPRPPAAAASAEPEALRHNVLFVEPHEREDMTHVLVVVEDDELKLIIVCRLSQHNGFRVSAAGSGEQALQALRRPERVDVVLMD